MTMVERVARAIRAADMKHAGVADWAPWEEIHPPHREVYLMRARAAIEEMREPTKEMVEVGYTEINNNIESWNYESDSGYAVEDIAPTATWRAMIDKALEKDMER
jgi:hypothetical protein